MITNFHEFDCLFFDKVNPITEEDEFKTGTVCIDLLKVVAFNEYTKQGYTVLRLVDANSYIVKVDYNEIMDLITGFALRFEN